MNGEMFRLRRIVYAAAPDSIKHTEYELAERQFAVDFYEALMQRPLPAIIDIDKTIVRSDDEEIITITGEITPIRYRQFEMLSSTYLHEAANATDTGIVQDSKNKSPLRFLRFLKRK